MEREKLEITAEDARDLVWGDGPEGLEIVQDEIVETTRWSTIHGIVVKRLSDGKFFGAGYSVGATEMQDESPWETDDPEFLEVLAVEKTVISYEWPAA